ncbi:MAG: bifunctional pyr operon transcriptional regulator/uracil phosphoribosyltransferase PyrR [Proteobacteria bacterium]|jgi:pyrimidine operon attenuation protein / uracil phosphoribosyltransferase|nr:bifunctional pyr operon transcriptional regulator/uracil phosphoribosyltransferase PyrR [Pseudomonadota bacterium]MCG6934459.1 bifunctional pyr operon transcriptional regulator/uracil phosphoribosyltransferase PyrR [Pseudomonadota bacterium]
MPEGRDVNQLLGQMASDLRSLLASRHISDPLMIGIHTGGVWVAEVLHRQLDLAGPLGSLNITFYRDDFTHIGMHPQVQPSILPFEVENHHIILVDDVLHTGRTIRAALNEIFDYGRPASIILATLVERSGRELPICADVVGTRIELLPEQNIKLSGPDPLILTKRGNT